MESDKSPIMQQQYNPPTTAGLPNPGPPPYGPTGPYHTPPPSQSLGGGTWQEGPITNQPQMQYRPSDIQIPKPWSTSLCDCCNKPGACILYFFCPCFFSGHLAKRLGSSFGYGCCCGRHFETISRPYIRAKHGIDGDFCNDCLITTFCGACSTCQVDRELDRLGYP